LTAATMAAATPSCPHHCPGARVYSTFVGGSARTTPRPLPLMAPGRLDGRHYVFERLSYDRRRITQLPRSSDAFVAHFDTTGTRILCDLPGRAGVDQAEAITTDGAGAPGCGPDIIRRLSVTSGASMGARAAATPFWPTSMTRRPRLLHLPGGSARTMPRPRRRRRRGRLGAGPLLQMTFRSPRRPGTRRQFRCLRRPLQCLGCPTYSTCLEAWPTINTRPCRRCTHAFGQRVTRHPPTSPSPHWRPRGGTDGFLVRFVPDTTPTLRRRRTARMSKGRGERAVGGRRRRRRDPLTWSVTNLPPGLSFSTNRKITAPLPHGG